MSKRHLVLAVAMVATGPALAQETRELGAHEHGVSELNLAFAGNQIAVELHAPGFDIVGFEYVPESAEDLAAVETALETLANPLALFQFPDAAGCSVLQAEAVLLQDDHDEHDEHDHDEHADHDDHDDHDHEEHADHDDHDHDDHEEHADHDDHDHDEHDHDEHADHDEHDHEEHADHDDPDHADHDDHDHAGEATHSEFRAEYLLSCDDVTAIDAVTMTFFDVFENSGELEVVVFTTSGAQSFELDGDNPVLDLSEAL